MTEVPPPAAEVPPPTTEVPPSATPESSKLPPLLPIIKTPPSPETSEKLPATSSEPLSLATNLSPTILRKSSTCETYKDGDILPLEKITTLKKLRESIIGHIKKFIECKNIAVGKFDIEQLRKGILDAYSDSESRHLEGKYYTIHFPTKLGKNTWTIDDKVDSDVIEVKVEVGAKAVKGGRTRKQKKITGGQRKSGITKYFKFLVQFSSS